MQPAAIDDLRRWTSTEAIGDITVTPDCVARVVGTQNTTATTTMHHLTHTHSLALSSIHEPSAAADATAAAATLVGDTTDAMQCSTDVADEMPLDHRLPSPEEQCQIIALRYDLNGTKNYAQDLH